MGKLNTDKDWRDDRVYLVEMHVCGRCLNGAGGMCHEPLCVFCRHKMDVLPVWREACAVQDVCEAMP